MLPLDIAAVGLLQQQSAELARVSLLVMVFGFLGNILLARLTPVKFIYLTGHLTWVFSIAYSYILLRCALPEWQSVLLGSAALALTLSITPALAQPAVRALAAGDDEFALGHFASTAIVLTGLAGSLAGRRGKSAEDIRLPSSLAFFRETAIPVSLLMLVFFLIVALCAGADAVAVYAGSQHYLVYALVSALGVAAGIMVLLYGIDLFLQALIPAFRGISRRCVPGAIPAVDIAAFMSRSPNALLLGFLFSTLGMTLGMFLSAPLFSVVPIIAVDAAFFNGGMAGILGNARGGIAGSIVGSFLYGFTAPLLTGLAFSYMALPAAGVDGLAFMASDVLLGSWLLQRPWIGLAVMAAVFALLCLRERRRAKRV